MKIEVSFKLGEVVKHSLADVPFKVIGYKYIKGYGVEYICIGTEDPYQQYEFKECELQKSKEKETICFTP